MITRSKPLIGVCVPNFRPGATPEAMIAATETAERLGWESVWTTDHILPDSSERSSPYAHLYEALATLAWLGGRSERVRLGISVLVVPMRNAVVLAKELASIDALTDGRLIAGVGIGWNKTEFGNLGLGDRFAHRGAYTEETIALWRHLWSGSQVPFKGRFHSFEDFSFSPLPPQGAQLPVWIGAHARPALERTGRVADGYQSTRTDAKTMRDRAQIIGDAARAVGRPMPVMSSRVTVHFDLPDQPAWLLAGSNDEIRGQVREYRDAGVEQLSLNFDELDPDALVAAMERFDREILLPL